LAISRIRAGIVGTATATRNQSWPASVPEPSEWAMPRIQKTLVKRCRARQRDWLIQPLP
jgi:hypothetical protein